MRRRHALPAALLGLALLAGACSDGSLAQPAEAVEVGDGAGAAAEAPGVRVQPAVEAAARLDDAAALVLDVRTPAEFTDGHLPGAVNIDVQAADFRDQVAALDPEQPVLLYCRSGNRSVAAREVLAELGFADVIDVQGGILAWADAGLPIVR
jgi:phage shock protein E